MDVSVSPSRALAWAWKLFDWAAQPFFTLIATFVFPPFFVTAIVGNAIEGQVVWGWTSAAAALLVGVTAPVFGTWADRSGEIRPAFLLACGIGVCGATGLWFCIPGSPYALPLAILCVLLSTLGFETATALNNAMLPRVADPVAARALAWKGWALGGASGVLVLLLFMAFFAIGADGKTVLGLEPLLQFADPASGPARLTGPIAALWFIIFLVPLFFLYRDHAPIAVPQLASSDTEAKPPSPLRFLIANMILSDALLALFVFGGIYAAAVFGWDTPRLAMLATALTIAGMLGVALCIPLDRRFGPDAIARFCCVIIVAAGVFILGLDPKTFFIWPAQRIEALGVTNAELAFVLASLMIGGASATLQSALRAMFISYATPARAGRSFGFFALSGKSTAFIGPLLVSFAMAYFDSTKAGIALVLVMIGIGVLFLRHHARHEVA